ncbi:MAG: hypothetical protein QM368_01115 [Bacillota bacterium]|nr:hypothetical protein [Bacillota bacterium]HHU29270.1 hypothetical protein [Bacillota bacterium]
MAKKEIFLGLWQSIKDPLSENRGAGELAFYKPWLSIQDFPSKGRVSRIKGWKTNEYIISFQIYKRDVSTCLNGMMK